MAITRAQQARQLLEDGGMLVQPSMDGKRPGYRSARAQEVQGRTPSTKASSPSQRSGASEDRGAVNDRSSDAQTINQLRNQNRFVAEDFDLLPGDTPDSGVDIKLNKREQEFQNFLNRRNRVNLFGSGKFFEKPAQIFSDYNASINRPFFKDVIRAGKFNYTTKDGKPLSFDMTEDDFEDAYQNYMSSRLRGEIDAYGNYLNQDNDNNIIIPDSTMNQGSSTTEQEEDNPFVPYRFMADGGMTEEEDDPVGGIMDLESGRQMYFLGKLVKKATRAVKKVVKSPFGKALILGGLTFGIPGVSKGFFSKGLMGTKSGIGLKNLIMGKPLGSKTAGDSVARSGGLLNFIKNNKALSGILGASTLAGLSAPQSTYDAEKEDEFSLNIPEEQYRFYAEGGKAEPVAKKTMPLLDMDGKEKDYRETGGFVDMGRMERADDVPARLSKNEFVFTADAVRNAGEGDIDKGAEVMYNMMKNLESGGEVSEESQGLDGARNMFQTSQRLEEVL